MKSILNWIKGLPWAVAKSLTQMLSSILFRKEDHSTSGETGYQALKVKKHQLDPTYQLTTDDHKWLIAERFINALFFWDKNHCYKSIEWDEVNDDPTNYPKPD